MRQITKQPALPEKLVNMENEGFGYKSIAKCLNNYFASVVVQDDSEAVISLNETPEIYVDDFLFKKVALNEEKTYVVVLTLSMKSAQNF